MLKYNKYKSNLFTRTWNSWTKRGGYAYGLGFFLFFSSSNISTKEALTIPVGTATTPIPIKEINVSNSLPWYFYSAEYPNGDIYYSDNQIYCPNLFMKFNENGTFTDYFVADYSANPNPICDEEDAFFGTFSIQDGYYQFTYEAGGNQDLSGSEIYITYPDSETMKYEFDSVLWTYKLNP